MHVDDEPWRALQEKGGVVAEAVHVENDARGVGRGLRGTDAGQEAVVGDFHGAPGKLRREPRSVKVEENAIGIGDARGLIADLLLEVNRHAGVVGRGPMPNARDQRQLAAARRRRRIHQPRVFSGRGGCAGRRLGGILRNLGGRLRRGKIALFDSWIGCGLARIAGSKRGGRRSSSRRELLWRLRRSSHGRVAMRAGTRGAVRRLGVCGSNLVAANVVQLAAGLCAERILRIETQKILVDSLRLLQVPQVALVDFPFGQQGAEAVAAAGVLVPQKFILADSVVESLVLLKDAPLFGKQIGNGGDRRIGPGRSGIAMVDGAVGVEDPLVLQTRPLLFGPALQRFTQPLSVREGCRPRGRRLRSRSQSRHRQNRERKNARTRRVRTGGPHRGSVSALHKRPNRPRSSTLPPNAREPCVTPPKTPSIIGAPQPPGPTHAMSNRGANPDDHTRLRCGQTRDNSPCAFVILRPRRHI